MRRAPQLSPSRPRVRGKATNVPTVTRGSEPRNVGSVEALASLVLGGAMVAAALIPRTFKQAFLLALGGGLAYRGLTGSCGFYRAAGIDTAERSPRDERGEKLRAAVVKY